ncbi:hypothetical protein DFJ73DRAFT_664216 [Zopfochytrium polystomum]|nr:hypothetical protein DFJ73DRAFT_664216 [Zopfochytrium polystomum]
MTPIAVPQNERSAGGLGGGGRGAHGPPLPQILHDAHHSHHGQHRIVVVGLGMVGLRMIESVVSLNDSLKSSSSSASSTTSDVAAQERFHITAFSEEQNVAYNRMLLTSYFEHRSVDALTMKEESWFAENGVVVVKKRVVGIDREGKTVTDAGGGVVKYDTLILATGSSAYVPPIPNIDAKGIFVYRTIEDLDAIIEYAKSCKRAAVIGGGLLGLEAAAALLHLNLHTSVIERNAHALARQLDAEGASVMMEELARLGRGLEILPSRDTERFVVGPASDDGSAGTDVVKAIEFKADDAGSAPPRLDCELVVVSVGIASRDELSRACGLEVHVKGGTVVDDEMRTSDSSIFAVGEAVSHQGVVYGLVQPGYEMCTVVASVLAAERSRRVGDAAAVAAKRFTGSDMSTKLKLAGVHVASFGEYFADRKGIPGVADSRDVITCVSKDPFGCSYKKLLFSKDGKRLYGGILVGDATKEYTKLHALARSAAPLKVSPSDLLGRKSSGAEEEDDDLPDEAQICSCNNVTKKDLVDAVKAGSTSLPALKQCTKAGTGCGGCIPAMTSIMNAEIKRMGGTVKNTLCEHFDYSRVELFEIVKITKVKTFRELLISHGKGDGCEICKPAIASILASLHNELVISKSHRPLQDTNDRFLANIQRGGSFSVVPRIAGGEITPDKLIVIGEVAKEFGLYTKITGGQRIDLFGARKQDLPEIWSRLVAAGFESGHAYGKSLRTVKSCVGSAWCRFGMRDSTRFAIDVENRYKGVRSPHKLKGGVSGCVRECAEAQSKDFGLIATEKGWNVYVGGNGGSKPKHAVLLASEVSEADVIKYLDRYLMYYISTADKLTRTARWLEKLEGGLQHLKDVVIHDKLGIAATLEAQMAHLVGTYKCEWAEVVNNPTLRAEFSQFANTSETQPDIGMLQKRGQPEPAPWPKQDSDPTVNDLRPAVAEIEGVRSWVDFGSVDEFTPETGRAVKHGDVQLAIFRKLDRDGNETWYATQNMCPHKRSFVLSQSLLGTTAATPDAAATPKLACPLHKKTFSLESGAGIDDPAYSIATFPTRTTAAGRVQVLLPDMEALERVLGTGKWMVGGDSEGVKGERQNERKVGGGGCGGGTCGDEKLEW